MRHGRSGRTGTSGAAIALALALPGVGALAPRHAGAETNAELSERVQTLEQELALLKRKLEVKDEETAARAPTTPVVTAGADGFALKSPDNKFQIKFRGYTQFDGRFFFDADSKTNDTFAFRRVRPFVEGTVGEFVDFRIMPDFAGNALNLFDAYVNVRYWQQAQVQAGKFKPPLGLERLQSATAMMFVERGAPTLLVPSRDLGVQLHGDLRSGLLSYQIGFFNGIRDGASTDNGDVDTDDGKDVVARVFAHPFQETAWAPLQGLGIGVAASWGQVDQSLSSFRTIGGTTFFQYGSGVRGEGDRFRISPQGYWYWGPFGLLWEYVQATQEITRDQRVGRTVQPRGARPHNDAWQVAASWVLTGESASYRGVVPRSSFDPRKGTWGAFEIAGRFGEIEFDDELFDGSLFANPNTSARAAHQWTVGLNWYMSRWLKFVVNYDRTWFDGGKAGGGNKDTESALLTRLQLNF